MNITRTACAKTCQHGATFIVETPLGYIDVTEVEGFGGMAGRFCYFFSMILEGWRYEWRLDRPKKLTRSGKSRLAAKFARECYVDHWGDGISIQNAGVERQESWVNSP